MIEKHGLLRSSFQLLNSRQYSGDGGKDVPPCIFEEFSQGNTNETETILTNQSSADSSKITTAQNKSDDAAKGLSKLGDSLNELSKSSKRVAQINADSANVQSLCNNIESL